MLLAHAIHVSSFQSSPTWDFYDTMAHDRNAGNLLGAGRDIAIHESGHAVARVLSIGRVGNLLEHSHRVDRPIEHDQLAGLGINTGRQELRRGCDYRIWLLRIDEAIQLGFAFGTIAGDPHTHAVP